MLSDIENLDIMLGVSNPEREESELSHSVRRPECPSYKILVNYDVNSHFKSREEETRGYARNGRNSGEVDSCSEIHAIDCQAN